MFAGTHLEHEDTIVTSADQRAATASAESSGDTLTITVTGRLDADGVATVWNESLAALEAHRPKRTVLDAGGVTYLDNSGSGLIVELRRRMREAGGTLEIEGLAKGYAALIDLFPAEDYDEVDTSRPPVSAVVKIGRATVQTLTDLRNQVSFLGEVTVNLASVMVHPARLRLKETIRIMEGAGTDAVPLVGLLGFLIGVILAFQSAIPMRTYGAELYVSDLVAIVMVRELGPLITAIIVAGRSGSAFAAEIGTMKVNEEIDALTTMGIPAVQFLVIPRIIAGVIVMPLLTIFANLTGLVGAALVVMGMGYPLTAYANRVTSAIGMGDVMSGLVKTLVFGAIIAGIGCLRGLQTGAGALSVGKSATRSVVAGIILVLLTDMVFAVLYYLIDL